MNDFNSLIAKLDGYEKEMEKLWEYYNPDDSLLKIEVTALKMSIYFYRYSVEIFEYIGDGFVDLALRKLRRGLTMLSYVLSASTIFACPQITPAAVLSSLYLHLKNKKDDTNMVKILNDEQAEILFDKMDRIEDIYVDKSNAIFDRTLDFESKDFIETFDEPEKTERIICNKFMNCIKNNEDFHVQNSEQEQIIKNIIKSTFGLDNDNFKELIKQTKKEYNKLLNTTIKLNNKDERLSILTRFLP